MTELFLILLRILFPLDPVRQVKEMTRKFLGQILDHIEDEDAFLDLLTLPAARITLEVAIAAVEDQVRILIEERARQILHLPLFQPREPVLPTPQRDRGVDYPLARLHRAIAQFEDIERLATRRAEQLQRERTENPLGISSSLTPIALAPLRLCSLVAHDGLPRRSAAKAGGGLAFGGVSSRAPPDPTHYSIFTIRLAATPARPHPRA